MEVDELGVEEEEDENEDNNSLEGSKCNSLEDQVHSIGFPSSPKRAGGASTQMDTLFKVIMPISFTVWNIAFFLAVRKWSNEQ